MTVSWAEVELGNVLAFSSGKSIVPGRTGAYPAFGSNGLIGNSDRSLFDSGIIIGRVGAYCGSTSLSRSPFWASDNTIVARPKDELDLDFAYFLLVQANLNRWAGGAAQPLLTQAVLKPLRFRIPPVPAQRRIASILRAYDDLIEVNRRRITILEEMARGLFEEWFVRFPGHEEAAIVETPNGLLPKRWAWKPLSALADLVGVSTAPSSSPDQAFLHYSFPAFDVGALPMLEPGSAILSNKLRFEGPVVLVGKLNPRLPRIWYVPNASATPQIASTEFLPLKPKAPLGAAGLSAYLRSAPFLDRMRGLAQGTSTSHQRARPGDILAIPLAVPPADFLAALDRQVEPITRMGERLREANRRLAASRDLLLPRLVSGELSVAAAERELEAAA